MVRRTTTITVAHARAFNHYVNLKTGCDIPAWNNWLEEQFGESQSVVEVIREQRWAIIGGNVGFRDPEDAMKFMEAANDDLARGKKLW